MSQKAILKKEGEYFFKGEFLKAGSEFEVKEIRGVNTWCFIDGELYPFRTADVVFKGDSMYYKSRVSISKVLPDGRYLNVTIEGMGRPGIVIFNRETGASLTTEIATEEEFNEAYEATLRALTELK